MKDGEGKLNHHETMIQKFREAEDSQVNIIDKLSTQKELIKNLYKKMKTHD
jgi:hypothetical protein